ncbi:MAG: tetratricopeptide repeat protein [Phycisphaerae bacterium]|nr:tetratricopeptide repeat protein [Phycisphaerae bacterium]NUQ47689.1 tetratricopeptide repeat protein [Phycisphaerae bacterium]
MTHIHWNTPQAGRRSRFVGCGVAGGAVLLVGVSIGCQTPATTGKLDDGKHLGARPSLDMPSDAEMLPPPKINAKTFFAAGRLHEKDGNLIAAADQYYRATLADPTFVMAWGRLGIILGGLGAFDRADESLRRAIELAPRSAFLWNNRAFNCMLQGNYELAEEYLNEALRLRPDYARARANLGVVLARTGRLDEAFEAFSRVVSRDAAWFNVGTLCVANQQLDLARMAFERGLKENPKSRGNAVQLDRLKQIALDPDSHVRLELEAEADHIGRLFGPPPASVVAAMENAIDVVATEAAPVSAPAPAAAVAETPAETTVGVAAAEPESPPSVAATEPVIDEPTPSQAALGEQEPPREQPAEDVLGAGDPDDESPPDMSFRWTTFAEIVEPDDDDLLFAPDEWIVKAEAPAEISGQSACAESTPATTVDDGAEVDSDQHLAVTPAQVGANSFRRIEDLLDYLARVFSPPQRVDPHPPVSSVTAFQPDTLCSR